MCLTIVGRSKSGCDRTKSLLILAMFLSGVCALCHGAVTYLTAEEQNGSMILSGYLKVGADSPFPDGRALQKVDVKTTTIAR